MIRAHWAEDALAFQRAQELQTERCRIVGLELDHVRRHLTHDGVELHRVCVVRYLLVEVRLLSLRVFPRSRWHRLRPPLDLLGEELDHELQRVLGEGGDAGLHHPRHQLLRILSLPEFLVRNFHAHLLKLLPPHHVRVDLFTPFWKPMYVSPLHLRKLPSRAAARSLRRFYARSYASEYPRCAGYFA